MPRASEASEAASIAINRAVAREELCLPSRAQQKAERSGKGGGWGDLPPSTMSRNEMPHLKKSQKHQVRHEDDAHHITLKSRAWAALISLQPSISFSQISISSTISHLDPHPLLLDLPPESHLRVPVVAVWARKRHHDDFSEERDLRWEHVRGGV